MCILNRMKNKYTTEIDFTKQIKQLEADKKAGYPPDCNKGYEEKDGKCILIKKDKDSTAQPEKWKKTKGAEDDELTPDEFKKVFEWVKKVKAYSHKVIDIRAEEKEVVIEDGLGNQFVMPEKKVLHHLIEDHGLSLSLLKRIANEGPEKALKGYEPKKI